MTSWVVTIDRQHPNHWAIAKNSGFWDLTRHRPIERGDTVYFWQAGRSFIAQTRATTDAVPITSRMSASWEDSGTRQYASRFEFEVLDEAPTANPRWVLDIGRELSSSTPDLRTIPGFQDPADEALLASFFGSPVEPSPMEKVARAILSQTESTAIDTGDLSDDEKKVVLILQRVREGQQKFRSKLVDVYGGMCAVTGTKVEQALDAAHIRPYSGPKSNILPNGLLLRGDIHRLFDKHRLTVVPKDKTYEVRVDPSLNETTYTDLDTQQLFALPADPAQHPNPTFLHEHHMKCAWLAK